MIDGLKLAITGEELILALGERIERYRSTIQYKRDQIDGKAEPPKEPYWEVPAETVEDEIRLRQIHAGPAGTRSRVGPVEASPLGASVRRIGLPDVGLRVDGRLAFLQGRTGV